MDNIFTISLKDFIIHTIIGILDFERKNKQKIIIDIDIVYKNIEILDYSILHDLILKIFNENQFYYLEDAINHIENEIISNFKYLINVDITIKKPDIFSDCIAVVHKKLKLENLLD